METFFKLFAAIWFISLVSYTVVFFINNDAGDILQEEMDTYEIFIGKEIIIRDDTLMITDYSMLNETFKLHNGTTISKVLLDKATFVPSDNYDYD